MDNGMEKKHAMLRWGMGIKEIAADQDDLALSSYRDQGVRPTQLSLASDHGQKRLGPYGGHILITAASRGVAAGISALRRRFQLHSELWSSLRRRVVP